MNRSHAKNTIRILTMRNYAGGGDIFSMSTSHPDGLPPATQPDTVSCCFVYILYKHTCETDTRQEVQQCFKIIPPTLMTKTLWIFMNLCPFISPFDTVTHKSYRVAPTLRTLLSMIHYYLPVCTTSVFHIHTPMNNCITKSDPKTCHINWWWLPVNWHHSTSVAQQNLAPSLHNHLQ